MLGIEKSNFGSERCELFKAIANEVWDDVNYHHSVGVDIPEIGITSRIVARIKTFKQTQGINFNVLSRPGYDEIINGSDLDIFVETNRNEYRWFALQAKVLKTNKRYHLRKKPNEQQQWEKLKILQRDKRCKAAYLLYNGMELDYTKRKDHCNVSFEDSQFGCSIVELHTIKKFANKQFSNGDFKKPHYNDFHSKYAQPWRVLVCCYLKKKSDGHKVYSIKEIEKDTRLLYPKKIKKTKNNNVQEKDAILSRNKLVSFIIKSDIENLFNDYKPILKSENRIIKARSDAGWYPKYKLVIRRTDSGE